MFGQSSTLLIIFLWQSSQHGAALTLRREARQKVLSQPYSGCEIVSGLWTVGEGGAAWEQAIARAKAWRRAGLSSPISEREGSKILLLGARAL